MRFHVGLLLRRRLAGPAAAHDGHELLVPRPDCIQTILNADTGVPADDCLAGTATFDTREGAPAARPIPGRRLETEQYRMIIHYSGGAHFPTRRCGHWPLSIELNYGGSGWFSYLLVLVETGSGMVGSGFVQPAGDRCNDGPDRFSVNGNGIYSQRDALPSGQPAGRDRLARGGKRDAVRGTR